MKKYINILIIILLVFFCSVKNSYAYSVDNYSSRSLCGTYELDSFKSDGTITKVGCYSSYDSAKSAMKSNGGDNLGILTKVSGKVKMIDANYALLDLSVNPTTLTYFYTDSNLTKQYTYMDTGSLYGGVDGALINASYSSTAGKWVAKVKIGSFTGWIPQEAYEIVPLTWIKSSSTYKVTSDSIRHNYVAKIQNTYSGSAGSTIGPKPSMLSAGTYYSYDGHYFYTTIKKMLIDYKNGNYNNAVNSTPYYNYYMYLSNHTKTNYSTINIDEYIRNNLGYTKDSYGNSASTGTSRLYGKGAYFYNTQQLYGVNAILSLSLSRNETSNGRSTLAINKNNGFGLNAVDTNPYQAAKWYASFAASIYGYATKWITNGYAKATDWRYFGPQFGEKQSGMNVKYAADTYWSEKMAANYYSFDKAFGLQDYDYYQEAVSLQALNAYKQPNTNSKVIYSYPEKEDALIIVDEVTGTSVGGSTKWYKVISDMNIDKNANVVDGIYNWDTNYVYVPSVYVKKINTAKNGLKSTKDITEYKDSKYTFDLYIENTELIPKVAQSIKNAPYYYDPGVQSKTGVTLLNNKYVMVYNEAKNENGEVVSYLVTSDYFHDQKHWVTKDAIKFVTSSYGVASVTATGNQYTWVNYNTEDKASTKISGLYTYTYVPILGETKVGSNLWYKVPVDLTSNTNSYGYTLASAPDVLITKKQFKVSNNAPIITAKDIEEFEKTEIDVMKDVKATDVEDKDITSKIKVTENTININVPGTYKVTYSVTDSSNVTTTKTIKVIIKEKTNNKPVINANDKNIIVNESFNEMNNVSAIDQEDGDLTNKIKVTNNNVNISIEGEYEVTYEVTDSDNNTVTKTIKVKVSKKQLIETSSEFYLDNLKWDNDHYIISGYLINLKQDNIVDAEYTLIIKNKDTNEEYTKNIKGWTSNVPFDLGKENNKDYTNSWFKDNIDLSNIPNGDYELYMKKVQGNYYSKTSVNNMFNKTIDKREEVNGKGFELKVMLSYVNKNIELSVRDKLITTKNANTFRTMINNYDDIKFIGNNIKLIGTSYNYDGTYNNSLNITRKVIFENVNSYERHTYDLGITNKGSYKVTSTDNKSKEYAWFDKEIDISNLPKGTYSIIIYTKTTDSEDYGELSDMFAAINKAESVINNKNYKVTLNKNRNNRIELVVE